MMKLLWSLTAVLCLHLPAAQAAEPAKTARMIQVVIARGVEHRAPVEPADRFDADVGKLWAHVVIENPGDPMQVRTVWKKAGEAKFDIALRVGTGNAWRTWSHRRFTAKDAGAWTVEVIGADGALLGSTAFDVASGVATR